LGARDRVSGVAIHGLATMSFRAGSAAGYVIRAIWS
jgi:hypothetical protein